MQAVILAGGLGTRLGVITRHVPKPMVPVAGKPYLEHQILLLRQQGIADIVLLIGYLGEQIENYFGDGSGWGVSIRYSKEATPMGTGGALRDARPLLADTFLVIYGDSYLPLDYADVMRALEASRRCGLMVVYDNTREDTSVRNNVAVRGPLVARYDKTAAGDPELRYVEAGVLAFQRSVIDRIPRHGAVSLEQQIFPLLIAGSQMAAYVTTQRFYDIGTPERLRVIEGLLTHDHHPDVISN
jgi:NDP-sugar pyrophosphorylase family protein